MTVNEININEMQIDALKEIINISSGKAASIMNTMISKHLKLMTPDLKIVTAYELPDIFEHLQYDILSEVKMPFYGAISGYGKLIFSSEDASKIVKAFVTGDIPEDEFDELKSGTLSEIGNIMLNSLLGSISNLFTTSLGFKVPVYTEGKLYDIFNFSNPDTECIYIIALTKFIIQELEINGEMLISMELSSFDQLLRFVASFSENYGN